MGTEPTGDRMAEVLPGRWRILASNLLRWLSGEQSHPVVDLRLSSVAPLVMAEEVKFREADGKHRVVRNRVVWRGESFVTRGGILRPGSRRWALGAASDDGSTVVVRHRVGRSALSQAALRRFTGGRNVVDGIDVMVRDGAPADEVRALVARDFDSFQLSLEEFASLGWLPEPDR